MSVKFPSGFHHYNKILGSCNGLLCIYNFLGGLLFLNPSTKQHHILPRMPMNYFFPPYNNRGGATGDGSVYGFGFEPISDDYKMVKIAQVYKEECFGHESEVRVYSLKTNTWRKLHNINLPFLNSIKLPSVMVGAALHWRVSTDTNREIIHKIIAFDLGTEDVREVPPPPDCLHCQIEVGVLEGCLTVLATHVNFYADLWVMKQYGVKESWTQLLWVASPGLPAALPGTLPVDEVDEVVKPLAYSKNGSPVLLQNKTEFLIWYDLEKKSPKDINIHGMPDTFDAFTFVESLVPLRF